MCGLSSVNPLLIHYHCVNDVLQNTHIHTTSLELSSLTVLFLFEKHSLLIHYWWLDETLFFIYLKYLFCTLHRKAI